MATILLNGVAYDAANVTDDNDKLTFSGGSSDALNVNLAGGNDLISVDAMSEDITNATMRGGEDDDVIQVVAGDAEEVDFIAPANIGGSLIGGPGADLISVADGLATLTGTIKGNEDDDSITLASANGGFVQGNSGDDSITLGFGRVDLNDLNSDLYSEAAGSRATTTLIESSINGSSGDDVIRVLDGVDLTNSTLRGNEGDDSIRVPNTAVADGAEIQGNAGNDSIAVANIEGAVIVRGGKGDDNLTVGNGQTVFGGLGADTFVVGASGGVFIEDFDKLDLDGDEDVDNADCFCDDEIQVQNIAFETYQYDVERVKYTSASSWTGDIKVKAVGDFGTNTTTTAVLAATKTETLTAKAVARLFITETRTDLALSNGNLEAYVTGLSAALPAVKYDATDLGVKAGFGVTKSGATFANGLADGPVVATNGNGAVVGKGIGAAYGQATGFWTQITDSANGRNRTAIGAIRNVVVATSNQFAKGDFSFLQLTATAKTGVATDLKLVFSDVTNATVKNHWASYNKVKTTRSSVGLYDMDFGTANFSTITTGKAYMVVTKGIEDKAYKTITVDKGGATATAKVTLDLDGTFEAWIKNLEGTGTVVKVTRQGEPVLTADGKTSYFSSPANAAGSWDRVFAAGGFGAGRTPLQLTWKTVTSRGLATLTTTARNTARAFTNSTINASNNAIAPFAFTTVNTVSGGTFPGVPTAISFNGNPLTIGAVPAAGRTRYINEVSGRGGISLVAGINNTNRTKDDFVTNTGRLVMKIAVSETDTAKAGIDGKTVVSRTTIFGQDLGITTCPDFPEASTLAGAIVNGQAKHGDVTGDFNTRYIYADLLNRIGTTGSGLPRISNAAGLTALDNARGGDGFFSASTFTVDALAAEGFGDDAVAQAGTNAKNVPFRVLFFDNDATSNGLHIVSGMADYNAGALTALNTNATSSSAMAGKHTIVKVTGGKGSVIELSDINLV